MFPGYKKNDLVFLSIIILVIINQIIKSSAALDCRISVPDTNITQKLNNIICLGESYSTYINFASFSNGSLIIESSKDNEETNRAFYGITFDGKPYFKNNQYFSSLNAQPGIYRKESKNVVIIVNDEEYSEYLISIANNINVELYNLEEGTILDTQTTSKFIGNYEMDSYIQSGINYYDGENYYLYHMFLTSNFYFCIRKIKFTENKVSDITVADSYYKLGIVGKTASCYMDDNKFILCLAFSGVNTLLLANIYISVFNLELDERLITSLGNYVVYPKDGKYTHFFKCIHLKGNVGVFAFYKARYTNMIPNLILSFKEYNDNERDSNKLTDFISEVTLDQKSFNMDCQLNDLIKITENKICFISTSEDKDEMYIVLLTLFYSSDYKIAIRYYTINIFSTYSFKIYKTIKAYLYNNFISLGFSYCKASSCSSDNDLHFSSFMFLNYPNGTDYNLDLLDEMITKNEIIDTYEINLHNQTIIDNNIFGLVYSTITIKKYTSCSTLIIRSSLNENVNIIEDYNLGEEENIIVKNIPTQKLNCSIAYSYIVTEPSFDKYNSYSDIEVFPDNSYTESIFSDETDYYESRLICYNISINEELSNICDNKNCLLCLSNNKMHCIICNNSYTINGKYKICDTDAEQTSAATYNKNEKTSSPITNKEKDGESINVQTEQSTNIQIGESTHIQSEESINAQIEESTYIQSGESTNMQGEDETNIQSRESNSIQNDESNNTQNEENYNTQNEESTNIQTEGYTHVQTEQNTNMQTEEYTKAQSDESINTQKEESINTQDEENSSDIVKEKITNKTIEIDYYSTEFIIEKTDSINCTKDGIINNECEKGLLTSEQMKEVYQYLKDYYVDNFNGESNIINTENVIFQVSTFEYQKNMGETNISSIDLGKCEERLKRNYNIHNFSCLNYF